MKMLLTTSLLFAVATPLVGQRWTAEETGLIDHIRACWTAWTDAQQSGGADAFFERCTTADDASMWWTEWGSPQSNDQVRREWPYFVETDLGWIAVNPVAVRIWGDVGMVQFYGYWKAQTPNGPTTTEYKRTELFRRVNGQWVFLGGQGSPSSAADADPYR